MFESVTLAINVSVKDVTCNDGGSYICPSPQSLDGCGSGGFSCVGTSYRQAGKEFAGPPRDSELYKLQQELSDLLSRRRK